ncbi:XrtA/PEP-CTERM system-associated ATPase [Azonexus sp.]|jgi:putative secretion ATPase (PEP-CTERM system associated)|uniref:XrtA/PEP-CTERM system-associated ATPase n=1 Tax=Azonexus sp. TaxID=1872668 RepID=UPI00282FC74C|nr:XrtA/PEP-CTERM system-associated ATPase [Azonexus sp.]MDR1996219.1 XrtA-associated ATPase [Azonexus sp.]
MYEAFYGLSSKPFQLNPDPSFYFGSKQHRRAAAYLNYGMHQNEGFIVITGEVGAGKTTIVRGMLDNLDPQKVVAAHLVSTQLDADDTLRLVGAAFGLRTKDVSKADVLMSLEAFLISATSKGKRCLLIVDEAQNLTARAVEELRMLSNFQFGNRALLQSYLIGQPEFRQMLQSPHMMQFRQRVTAACHIGPLDVEETRAYIEHRLKCAGSSGSPTISDSAYEAIFKASSGIPRRINTVCDRLLLFGYLSGKKDFDVTDVEEVAREIHGETMGDSTYALAAQNSLSPYQTGNLQPLADGDYGDDPGSLLAGMNLQQFGKRLARLERSMLQLEKINSATLSLLQQLVADGRQLTKKSSERD